jgi:hypothetical protein
MHISQSINVQACLCALNTSFTASSHLSQLVSHRITPFQESFPQPSLADAKAMASVSKSNIRVLVARLLVANEKCPLTRADLPCSPLSEDTICIEMPSLDDYVDSPLDALAINVHYSADTSSLSTETVYLAAETVFTPVSEGSTKWVDIPLRAARGAWKGSTIFDRVNVESVQQDDSGFMETCSITCQHGSKILGVEFDFRVAGIHDKASVPLAAPTCIFHMSIAAVQELLAEARRVPATSVRITQARVLVVMQ